MEPGAFRTTDGVSVTAVTADEMRAVDDAATEELGLSLLQMMENAGRALAEHILKNTGGPVVVAAGNGGNGGGGLVCARHLWNHGRSVTVQLDRPAGSLSGAAAHQFGILETSGVPATVVPDARTNPEAAVVVDAVIGYGLSGPVRGAAEDQIVELNGLDAHVVSLDVPSGLDATTGDADGPVVDSDHVLTLALPKTGLTQLDSPLSLTDISIPEWVYERLEIPYEPPFDTRYTVPLECSSG